MGAGGVVPVEDEEQRAAVGEVGAAFAEILARETRGAVQPRTRVLERERYCVMDRADELVAEEHVEAIGALHQSARAARGRRRRRTRRLGTT